MSMEREQKDLRSYARKKREISPSPCHAGGLPLNRPRNSQSLGGDASFHSPLELRLMSAWCEDAQQNQNK